MNHLILNKSTLRSKRILQLVGQLYSAFRMETHLSYVSTRERAGSLTSELNDTYKDPAHIV